MLLASPKIQDGLKIRIATIALAIISIACTCINMTLEEEYDKMNCIFYGKAIDTDTVYYYHHRSNGDSVMHSLQKTTLKVIDSFKGNFGDEISIYSAFAHRGNCGFTFKQNDEYLVFASRWAILKKESQIAVKGLFTGYCDRTTNRKGKIDKLRDELRKLRNPDNK